MFQIWEVPEKTSVFPNGKIQFILRKMNKINVFKGEMENKKIEQGGWQPLPPPTPTDSIQLLFLFEAQGEN